MKGETMNKETIATCEQCHKPIIEGQDYFYDNGDAAFHENGTCDAWVKEDLEK